TAASALQCRPMSEMKDKLRALLANRGVMTGTQWQARVEEIRQRREAGDFEVHRVIPGELCGEDDRAFFRVCQDFPRDHLHGSVALGDVLDAVPQHIALSACDD